MIGLYSANSQSITAQPFSFGDALQFDGVNDFVSFSQMPNSTSWTVPLIVHVLGPESQALKIITAKIESAK